MYLLHLFVVLLCGFVLDFGRGVGDEEQLVNLLTTLDTIRRGVRDMALCFHCDKLNLPRKHLRVHIAKFTNLSDFPDFCDPVCVPILLYQRCNCTRSQTGFCQYFISWWKFENPEARSFFLDYQQCTIVAWHGMERNTKSMQRSFIHAILMWKVL